MTKSLTEQLKNGTLKDGVYYIKDNENIFIGIRYCLTMTRLIDDGCPSFEVLAPVPSYDEYKKLKEQLKEANRVIKRELRRQSPKGGVLLGDINDYLKKWGVK